MSPNITFWRKGSSFSPLCDCPFTMEPPNARYIYASGAAIDLSKILCGDPSMSALELWGAEYQENDALLLEVFSTRIALTPILII
eukprot:152579-Amorphochlora_amoeboformis.AAC.1